MIYKIYDMEHDYHREEFCYNYSNMKIINHMFTLYPHKQSVDNDYVIKNSTFNCATLDNNKYYMDNYQEHDVIIFME